MLKQLVVVGCLSLGFGCASHQEAARAVPQVSAEGEARVAAGHAAFMMGNYDRAVEEYSAAVQEGADGPLVHFRYGYALHVTGHPDAALPHHVSAARIKVLALRIDALYNAACANALMGHRREALAYLDKAIKAGFRDTAQVRKDTDLDSLRRDSEFNRLIATMGRTPLPVSRPA